jgi:hypothetical protein
MSEKDGGSAFPQIESDAAEFNDSGRPWSHTYSYGGMTLRDYFAAHAPKKPAQWFRVAGMPPHPKRPHGPQLDYAGLSLDEQSFAAGFAERVNDPDWGDDYMTPEDCLKKLSSGSTPPAVIAPLTTYITAVFAWLVQMGEYEAAVAAWRDESHRRASGQWPWAYADAMLAERDK